MADSKLRLWLDTLLEACNGSEDSEDAVKAVAELTRGPVTFTEEDFADHLRIHHPDIPARIELEDGYLNVHASLAIFSLTFVFTAEADPSGKMAYLRQERGTAIKQFLDIEGICERIGALNYDHSNRTISLDLSKMPKDVSLKAFEIRKGGMEVDLREEPA
ncbi:MAG: hypothetical protein GY800_01340 [Planctomycetes bacterium]|nr:hypothetical protein [Planctomycetota bacterium]